MESNGTALTPKPTDADHVRGSLEAPVVITEYGDFECPYCGEAYFVLEDVLEKYGVSVALVFRNFPLPMHPHALAAAEAAEAAGIAGRFWEMHDELYRHQNALTDHDLQTYAKNVGVDPANVEAAIRRRAYGSRIDRDELSGERSGVAGTPALFINGIAFEGDVSVDELSQAIERAMQSAGTS